MMPNGSNGFNTIITPTPQPARCPNCHDLEDIKRVCNHCNYVYPKPENKPMGFWGKLGVSAFILFVVIIIAFTIDLCAFNHKYFNKIAYGSECNYSVPAGYSIILNKTTGKYAVAILSEPGEYLWEGNHGITTMYASISQPTTFDTDCEARAYLKAYIKKITPEPGGFK